MDKSRYSRASKVDSSGNVPDSLLPLADRYLSIERNFSSFGKDPLNLLDCSFKNVSVLFNCERELGSGPGMELKERSKSANGATREFFRVMESKGGPSKGRLNWFRDKSM